MLASISENIKYNYMFAFLKIVNIINVSISESIKYNYVSISENIKLYASISENSKYK